jgi:tetratricopeptide (TPR) repeat protein
VSCSRLFAALIVVLSLGRSARAADTWIEVRSDHFIVIADVGERKARNVAWQFEQVRSAIRQGFPWAQVDLNRPMIVIAVKDEDDMRKIAPQFWEQRGTTHPASVFVSGPDRFYVALQANVEEEGQGLNPWVQAYWSYSALVFDTNFNYRLPLWLTDGIASLLSNTIVSEKEIRFGSPIPSKVEMVRTAPLRPLAELFEVTRQSPYYTQGASRERFDAQCWSLVQFLMFGDRSGNGTRINQVVKLMLDGQSSAAALQQIYGSLDALDQAYRLYVHQGAFRFGRLHVDTDTSMAKYPERALTAAESAALRAGFHAAMNRPIEARALLAEARSADASLAAADDVDAILLDREQKRDEALQAFAKAAERGSTNFWTYYRLAMLSSGPRMDAAAMADLRQRLEKTTTLNPQFAPAFGTLANVQMQLREPDRALESAHRAATLEPNDLSYRVLLARLLVATNDAADAAVVAREALPLARSDQERATLQGFLAAPAATPAN